MGTTPVYNIPYPAPLDKARDLPAKIETFALGVEAALLAAGTPPVVAGASVVAASAAARDLFWGVPANSTERLALQARGATTTRTDKGWTERYYAGTTDGGTNPGGRATAGWHRVSTPFGKASGSVQSTANTTGNTVIAFPAGEFTLPPLPKVQLTSVAVACSVVVSGVTTNQMTVQTFNTNTGAAIAGVSFTWFAEQATATSAGE